MRFMLMLPFVFAVACAGNDAVETVSAALTADQCTYFAAAGDGRVAICHATSSAKNPYVIIRTDEQGCINGHESHAGDKISLDGRTCDNGCFPPGAPVDANEKCCEGEPVGGFCPQCIPGECQKEGRFDMKEGACIFEPMPEGTSCDDEDACTKEDRCNKTGECFGFTIDGCGCSADAQKAGDDAFWACKNDKAATDCYQVAKEAFMKAYGASGCKESPAEWKAP